MLTLFTTVVFARCPSAFDERACLDVPMLSFGAGYSEAGRHSGPLYQLEYKFGYRLWNFLRPQVGIDTCEFKTLLIYGGIGIDIPFCYGFFSTVSFSPGIYFKGRGRNLGYPIEFRSALDIYYVFANACRFGGQCFHVSNAHLSRHNPGMNGYVFYFSFPF